MEYILIDSDKLKIILEQKDLDMFCITAEALDYSSPPAKKVFEELLGLAKSELGFDTAGKKLLLELYPSRDGGCELFLTKLPDGSEGCFEDTEDDMPKKKNLLCAYSFERLDDLLSLAKQLNNRDIVKKSSAWRDLEGRWYILLECSFELPLPEHELFSLSCISFLSEYGTNEAYRQLHPYLSEYATPVCKKNAVQILGCI